MEWSDKQKLNELLLKYKENPDDLEVCKAMADLLPSIAEELEAEFAKNRALNTLKEATLVTESSPGSLIWRDSDQTWWKVVELDGVVTLEPAKPPEKFMNKLKGAMVKCFNKMYAGFDDA